MDENRKTIEKWCSKTTKWSKKNEGKKNHTHSAKLKGEQILPKFKVMYTNNSSGKKKKSKKPLISSVMNRKTPILPRFILSTIVTVKARF